MKKIMGLAVFAICFVSLVMFGAPSNSEDLYNEIKKHYFKDLPRDFVANVSGTEIDKSVRRIPLDSYCDGKKPKVTYLFLKGEEESIIVENVENPYVTRFQTHLEVYKGAKSFLDKGKNYSEIKKIFQWEFMKSLSKTHYVIKMRKHRLRLNDYFLLYMDKANYSLVKAVQYSNGQVIGTITVSYKRTSGYLLPGSIRVNYNKEGKKKSFVLSMTSHRINIGLNSNKIIDLQDDCPSL